MSALDGHQQSDLSSAVSLANVLGSCGEHQILRVQHGLPPDGVELSEGAVYGRRSSHVAGGPDGKEDRTHAAVAEPRDVDRAVRMPDTQIESVKQEPLRCVYVTVDNDRAEVKIPGL